MRSDFDMIVKDVLSVIDTGISNIDRQVKDFDERRKELFMEGDRWYELKRNGCPKMYVISNLKKYTTYEYLYTFPINRNDVDLGGLKQNEGYKY